MIPDKDKRPEKARLRWHRDLAADGLLALRWGDVFGETPKTATETVALPEAELERS